MEKDEINMTALVPIVIPSYEPDGRLISLLEDLDSKGMGPVIIVNDGSSEEYDPIFKQAEALITKRGGKFIAYRPNRGKGRALKTAFSYIAENMPDALGCVTADSDGQHTPGCIASIISAAKFPSESRSSSGMVYSRSLFLDLTPCSFTFSLPTDVTV